MSHAPADVRQMTAEDMKASFGQVLLTPLQLSATSQTPAEPRHTAVDFASAGQLALEPEQNSAGSQTPPEARHWLLELLNWQVDEQHEAAVPFAAP